MRYIYILFKKIFKILDNIKDKKEKKKWYYISREAMKSYTKNENYSDNEW